MQEKGSIIMQSESASTQQGSGTKKTGRKSIDEKDENAAAAAVPGPGADDAHQRPAGQRHGGGLEAEVVQLLHARPG